MKNHPINIGSKIEQSLRSLPNTCSTDGIRGDLPAVYIFTPDANATWILWEYDPDEELAFGLCDMGLGYPELGYVSIIELMNLRGRFGLPVEIDKAIKTRFAGYENLGLEVPAWLQ